MDNSEKNSLNDSQKVNSDDNKPVDFTNREPSPPQANESEATITVNSGNPLDNYGPKPAEVEKAKTPPILKAEQHDNTHNGRQTAPFNDVKPPIHGSNDIDADKTAAAKRQDFPFKPVGQDDEMNFAPQIGVSLEKHPPLKKEENENKDKIDVGDYESLKSAKTEYNPGISPAYQQESRSYNRGGRSAIFYSLIAIFFIAVGFCAGYFSYKYFPKLGELLKISADTNSSNSSTNSSITAPLSTSAIIGSLSTWPSYSNSQYVVKYPDTWYGKNLNDPNAQDVAFSSFNPKDSTDTTAGYSVEFLMQKANGKKLVDWISENNTVSGVTSSDLTSTQVAGMEAFYQSLTIPKKSIKTYLMIGDEVLTISYSAKVSDFSQGQKIYNQILSSIKI